MDLMMGLVLDRPIPSVLGASTTVQGEACGAEVEIFRLVSIAAP